MNTAALKAQMVLKSQKMGDLSKAIGISKSALYRRMCGKANFNRDEIQKIIRALDLSDETAMSIFFAD